MSGLGELIFLYMNGIILVGMKFYAFTCIFKPSARKIWFFLAYLAFLIATTHLFLLFYNVWITLLSNISAYIALTFLFRGNISSKIVYSILLYITAVLSEGMSVVLLNLISYIQNGVGVRTEDVLPVARTVAAILQLPLILIIIQLFRRYINKKARYRHFKIPIRYTAVVVLMLLGTVLLSVLFVYSSIDEVDNLFGQLTLALLLSAGVIPPIIWLYNTIMNHLEEFQKNRQKFQMLQRWEVLYNTATSSQKTISTLNHNIRYDLLSLSGYLEENNIQKAKDLISNRIGSVDSVISTGNAAIDTMLNYYRQRANEILGIDPELGLLIPPDLNIDANLTALILGNALENAVEACLALQPDRRYIRVVAEITAHSKLLITITNPYSVSPVSDSEGNLITTKDDKQNHGLGLSGIKDVLPDDVGQIHTEYSDGIFNFKLVFYNAFY